MTRLARRNFTRRVKFWKKRGFILFRGRWWQKMSWNVITTTQDRPMSLKTWLALDQASLAEAGRKLRASMQSDPRP